MAKLTREQDELLRNAIDRTGRGIRWGHNEQCNITDALKALRACDAPEVAKDAERYRWLRNQHTQGRPMLHYIKLANQEIHWHFPSPQDVDAAIDAAMQAGRKHD